MAINLQANANTQQAVGAFNALAASIANATNQFNNLNRAMQNGASTSNRYASSVTAINSAFSNLMSMANGLFNVLQSIGGGIQLVFTSLLRELDKLQGFNAIMSVTTKTADQASGAYDFLRKTADKLGVQFETLTSNYAKLVASLPAGTQGLQIAEKAFMGVAAAARTLHATNQDTQLMFYAITQMASKGQVSMEELRRQLGEKLPGVMQIAAKALNTLPETLEAAIRKGVVSSEKFLPIFGDALIRTFGDSAEKASQSVSASINRLTNVWVDFVKEVLDSGAGQSIVAMFDALREKLSDPYLISRFAELVKYLADKFTEFIKNITQEDIRNGFDTFTHAIEVAINLVGKLIEAFTWIINNGGKAGAIIGAVGGAMVGMTAGPWGALTGGVAGGIAGGVAGSSISPSSDQLQQRAAQDTAAQAARAQKQHEQEMLKFNELIPLLQQFKGLNTLNGLDNLFKAENLNTKTLSDLNRILTGKEFKTDKDRAQGVRDYAKYGTVVGPQTSTLKDVIGGPGKKSAEEKKLDASFNRAHGFDANFFDEWARYNTLFKQGKLTTDELTEAQAKLLAKQPFMEEAAKKERKALEEYNKGTELMINQALKQVEVKEKINRQLDDELRMAGMRHEDQQIESQMTNILNQYADHGVTLTKEQITALKEKLLLIQRTKEITAAEDAVLAQTTDKYKGKILEQQGIDKTLADPTSGLTKQAAQDYTVGQDQNFQGSQQWIDAQKRALEEYYLYIDMLRSKDRISEETAAAAKARAAVDYDKLRLANTRDFFSNLSSLSQSGNSKLAAIGKAAAVTTATIDGVIAVQKALAAPPGWPYNAANVISVGIAQAANVAKIAGFESGGYTGNYGTSEIAGLVHGREFVVHADATAKNRQTLEAMNRGQSFDGQSSGSNVRVIVNNNSSNTQTTQTERDTPTGKEVIVTIENVVVKQIKSGGPIADAMESQYQLNRAAGTTR